MNDYIVVPSVTLASSRRKSPIDRQSLHDQPTRQARKKDQPGKLGKKTNQARKHFWKYWGPATSDKPARLRGLQKPSQYLSITSSWSLSYPTLVSSGWHSNSQPLTSYHHQSDQLTPFTSITALSWPLPPPLPTLVPSKHQAGTPVPSLWQEQALQLDWAPGRGLPLKVPGNTNIGRKVNVWS